jgi:hypothetical protein
MIKNINENHIDSFLWSFKVVVSRGAPGFCLIFREVQLFLGVRQN